MNARKEYIGRAVNVKTSPGTVYDFLNGCNGIVIDAKGTFYYVVVYTPEMTNNSLSKPLAQFTYSLTCEEIEVYDS